MAAKHFYLQGFLLLLFNFISTTALDRRFSDLKRCADQECSMLLCRGKAVRDFSGPDCRFLSFKKSETVYVYYKLSGRRVDLWAGSVGNHFGYFPKDLLALNHIYTEKELEVPAEETDFVCFDNGFDQFDNYNVDLLLGSSVSEIDSENKETFDQTQVTEDTSKQTQPSTREATDSEYHFHDSSENVNMPDYQSASLLEADVTSEPPPTKIVDTADIPNTSEAAAEDTDVKQETVVESVFDNVSQSQTKDTPTAPKVESVPEDEKTTEEENEPLSISEGVQIPELKTTLGTTFDAVTTDEEITKRVTSKVQEESKDVEIHPEDDTDVKEETPLLSFSEESGYEKKEEEHQPISISEGVQIPELKTTFGTTFDAVTTDEEITKRVTSKVEEEHKDVEIHPEDDTDVKEETPLLSFSEESRYEKKEEELQPISISEGVQIPELKTTFGTTFDAVTTDEEITKRVTPKVQEESKDVEIHPEDDTDVKEETPLLSFSEESRYEKKEEEHQPISISEGVQIPELKTTFGTTFDAVTTDEEITKRVTPKVEEEHKDVEIHPEDDNDVKEETPLLSFSEESENTAAPDSPKLQEIPLTTHNDKSDAAEEQNMWTSLGDAVFSVVTGGERTLQYLSSEEDEEDEDEEEVKEPAASNHLNFEEEQKDAEEPSPAELMKEPEVQNLILQNTPESSSVPSENKETFRDSEELQFFPEDKGDETVEHKKHSDETRVTQTEKSDIGRTTYELPIVDKEEKQVSKHSEIIEDNRDIQDSSVATEHKEDSDNALGENKMVTNQDLAFIESASTDKIQLNDSDKEEKIVESSLPNDIHSSFIKDFESNSQQELFAKKPGIDELHLDEREDEKETEEDNDEDKELLEDENALFLSELDNTDSDKPSLESETLTTVSTQEPEPEYSDSVLRLTLLRDHFTEQSMNRFQKLLGLKNLYKVEAMFADLDTELQATRLSHTGTSLDIESTLESILEASENTILDEIESMLDSRDTKHNYDDQMDISSFDEETEILDDFQEFAFSLRQKYSTVSDSTPLATKKASDINNDELELNVTEDMRHIAEEDKVDMIPEPESDNDNLTVSHHEEKPVETQKNQIHLEEVHTGPDLNVEEDGGHFNKNEDNQQGFSVSDEMQKVPQATLENPLDMGFGAEMERSPSGSLDSVEPVAEVHEEDVGTFSAGVVYMSCILSMIKNKTGEWTIVMISLLPDEWKPGETLLGCPWQAVVTTALVGVLTFTLFFWRTVLAVKKREYLVDEKKLSEQIQALKKEKNDVVEKMSELQKQTEQLKQNQKQSKETVSSTKKRMQELESKVLEAETRNEQIAEEKNKYTQLLEEERSNSLQNQTRIEKLEKANEKLQLSRKKIQEAFAKTTVLLDEAKIREDARNVHQKCLEKEYATLKEENKTLQAAIRGWEDKHKAMSEQIKVYHKSQKELEDSVVLKDHNVEVLSDLLADLDACDLQKCDSKVLANGEVEPDKKTVIKNRIKQMMDVSRVQTTLTVVEEERDRFMTKLLNEEKSRKTLEEKHQDLEHAIATIKGEKSHIENQFKILQQKNEIMVEMYQQKENALQQRLTQEELERRSKENLLSEVGGKAVEAEEQVKVLRLRINEMEEQMTKTEEVYKEQIKEQENKTHSNWVNARNAERALNQEKLEASKLREKLAVLTSQLNERRAPLFRPNSGQPSGPRQGDSYGPSPVSGGAPSPPLMIEGPRRPPSAPVGRRNDPYGPRPPSDPHGRYPENKHISGMDMMGPRSSSPANMDGSTQAVDPQIKAETQAEASTESPEPGPGSFLASPIRDSPGPMVQGPPPGPGPHDPLLPPGPLGRLPPRGLYRPPRPGLYHLPPGPLHGPTHPNVAPPLSGPPLPANGHPGMPFSGGEFGPRPPNGHVFNPRPGPGPVIDSRGPPPPQFRPQLPHHFGPMPPTTGIRGPVGPRIPFDMRFPGPHDHTRLPGVQPHPAHPGDSYGQAPPDALHNSAGAHGGPGQDLHLKQEAPQDSVRPTMVKP